MHYTISGIEGHECLRVTEIINKSHNCKVSKALSKSDPFQRCHYVPRHAFGLTETVALQDFRSH